MLGVSASLIGSSPGEGEPHSALLCQTGHPQPGCQQNSALFPFPRGLACLSQKKWQLLQVNLVWEENLSPALPQHFVERNRSFQRLLPSSGQDCPGHLSPCPQTHQGLVPKWTLVWSFLLFHGTASSLCSFSDEPQVVAHPALCEWTGCWDMPAAHGSSWS